MRPSWAAWRIWQGLGNVFSLLLAVLVVATGQAFALPPVRSDAIGSSPEFQPSPADGRSIGIGEHHSLAGALIDDRNDSWYLESVDAGVLP